MAKHRRVHLQKFCQQIWDGFILLRILVLLPLGKRLEFRLNSFRHLVNPLCGRVCEMTESLIAMSVLSFIPFLETFQAAR
jgi:hypothetical protein